MSQSPTRFTRLASNASALAVSLGVAFFMPVAANAANEAPSDSDSAAIQAAPDAATFTLAASTVDLAVASDRGQPEAQLQSGPQSAPPAQTGSAPAAPGSGSFQMPKIVFDETWASVGIGAGLVPSYSGSDDYIVFPLPLIVGRVGGVGISPNGPGFVLDLNSAKPGFGPQKSRISFGPAFRIRNDRVAQIEDTVVEQLEDLDLAVELGGNIGISIPGVISKQDALTLSTQVRWDVAGAHEGMLIEPSVGYRSPISKAALLQINASVQFVDDSFADYYYSLTPAQSAASGLPVFNADGGLNSIGTTAILNYDLDGNVLNGGLNIYGVAGYTRLIGDAANTPFTAIRGDANQFILGLGIGYTF